MPRIRFIPGLIASKLGEAAEVRLARGDTLPDVCRTVAISEPTSQLPSTSSNTRLPKMPRRSSLRRTWQLEQFYEADQGREGEPRRGGPSKLGSASKYIGHILDNAANKTINS